MGLHQTRGSCGLQLAAEDSLGLFSILRENFGFFFRRGARQHFQLPNPSPPFDEVIKARKQNGRMKHSKKYLEYRADLYKNRQSGMKKKAAADNGEEVSQKRTKCEDVVLDF